MWANSIVPYLPARSGGFAASRYDWLRCPVIQPQRYPNLNYSNARRRPVAVTYTYNGLLHAYQLAGIQSPHIVPALWEGRGRAAHYGFAISNPVLDCSNSSLPCRYQPRDPNTGFCPSRSLMVVPLGSFWIHPKGVVFVYADGSAGWRRLGLTIGGATDPNYDPWTSYDDRGIPAQHWWDGCHVFLFRPDRTQ